MKPWIPNERLEGDGLTLEIVEPKRLTLTLLCGHRDKAFAKESLPLFHVLSATVGQLPREHKPIGALIPVDHEMEEGKADILGSVRQGLSGLLNVHVGDFSLVQKPLQGDLEAVAIGGWPIGSQAG